MTEQDLSAEQRRALEILADAGRYGCQRRDVARLWILA